MDKDHENAFARNIGQGEARQRKYKNLNLGVVQNSSAQSVESAN
jgi:hypothetical protein